MQTTLHARRVWQGRIQNPGAPLLNQQGWCWGQDIRHPQGNVLLRYGFECHRAPDPTRGSSVYTCQLTPEQVIVLWGFGVLYAQASIGGLFLARSDCTLHVTSDTRSLATVHTLDELPMLHAPPTAEEWQRVWGQAAALFRWISTYERWVIDSYSLAYRQTCVQGWHAWDVPRPSVKRIQAQLIAPLWRQLAERCAACACQELNESEDHHDLPSVSTTSTQ